MEAVQVVAVAEAEGGRCVGGGGHGERTVHGRTGRGSGRYSERRREGGPPREEPTV